MAHHDRHDVDRTDQRLPLPLDAIPDADLRHEWAHFRGYGWDDHRVASRLGVEIGTMQQWNTRYRRANAAAPAYSPLAALPATARPRRDVSSPLSVPTCTVNHDFRRLRLITHSECS